MVPISSRFYNLGFWPIFDICLGQVGPKVWRLVACFCHLAEMDKVDFSLQHLLNLNVPKPFRGGPVAVVSRGTRNLVNTEDDQDRGL